MARGGIYKSEVIRARDRLMAMGRYPSVDAVRQELGNTGSKTTIQRFLKEIDEEQDGKTGGKVAISEALHDIVARLAERLNLEADERVAAAKASHEAEIAQLRAELDGFKTDLSKVQGERDDALGQLAAAKTAHQHTAERLNEVTLAHTRSIQEVSDLQRLLRAEEGHRQSLEEKYSHSCKSLEHFQAAAKEQREHERREHEQQVQYLQAEILTLRERLVGKESELSVSNQEKVQLTTDLARAERGLHEAKHELRGLKGVKEELGSAAAQVERLGRQVVELQAELESLRTRANKLEESRAIDLSKIHDLELELATAKSAVATQEQLAETFQAWIGQMPAPKNEATKRR